MLVPSGDSASMFVPICTLCFSYLFLLACNCWDVDFLGDKIGSFCCGSDQQALRDSKGWRYT